jgi:hypothetical protein
VDGDFSDCVIYSNSLPGRQIGKTKNYYLIFGHLFLNYLLWQKKIHG